MPNHIEFERAVWKHRGHACPECNNAPKLRDDAPSSYYVGCSKCDFATEGRHESAVDAFAEWGRIAPQPRNPYRTFTNAAADDMCARAIGWIDFPTDSGDGGRHWYTDPVKAPFCDYVAKEDWSPSTNMSDAMHVVLTLNLGLDVTDRDIVVRNGRGYHRHILLRRKGTPELAAEKAKYTPSTIAQSAAALYARNGPITLLHHMPPVTEEA